VQAVAGKNELAMHMNITAKSGFGDQRGPGRAWTWPSLAGQANRRGRTIFEIWAISGRFFEVNAI